MNACNQGMEVLTSASNPRVKQLLALQEKSRLRRDTALFVVEGRREFLHCISAGFQAQCVFFCPEAAGLGKPGTEAEEKAALKVLLEGLRQEGRVVQVSPALYGKMARRGGTEGIVAEIAARERTLPELETGENALIVVVESVEKPGNLGAIFRSADAAGADAVLVCDPMTDLWNPNLIRASLGSVFTVPCAVCTSEEAIEWLKARGYGILTAQLQDSRPYYDTDMTGPTAIVLGSEAGGLSEQWRAAADRHIMIPMLGRLDSLNVSVSAAILLYEAVRQRQSNA